MSTLARMYRSDVVFCAALCALSACWLLARHWNHPYTSAALPPVQMPLDDALGQVAAGQLRCSALSGPPSSVRRQGPRRVARWLGALGMAYSDNFELTGSPGQLDSARLYLDQAAGMDSTNPLLLQGLGSVCMSQSDYRVAVAASRQAVALDSSLVPALGNQVSAFMALNMPDSAAVPMAAMLRLRPHTPTYNYLLGRWHYSHGRLDSAAACLEREIAAAAGPALPGVPDPVRASVGAAVRASHRILMSCEAERGKLSGARAHFEELMRLEPDANQKQALTREWEQLRRGAR